MPLWGLRDGYFDKYKKKWMVSIDHIVDRSTIRCPECGKDVIKEMSKSHSCYIRSMNRLLEYERSLFALSQGRWWSSYRCS